MIGDIDPELLTTLTPPAWMRDAACIEHPELDWFNPDHYPACRRVCRRCLVNEECATYVAELEIADGMWAGLTPGERSGKTNRVRTRRVAARQACGSCGREVAKLHDGDCWGCHIAA
jgi:Transcription factor WhiB